ncbi:MAG: hypothetical protein CMJ22_10910 [Phycisphaerae bacterium]|nr:hypothetical protein [Phycisphaerae bacterium]
MIGSRMELELAGVAVIFETTTREVRFVRSERSDRDSSTPGRAPLQYRTASRRGIRGSVGLYRARDPGSARSAGSSTTCGERSSIPTQAGGDIGRIEASPRG